MWFQYVLMFDVENEVLFITFNIQLLIYRITNFSINIFIYEQNIWSLKLVYTILEKDGLAQDK